MNRLLCGIALLISTSQAVSATWVLIGWPNNLQHIEFYDADSVQRHKQSVTIWTRTTWREGAKSKSKIQTTVVRTRYNCGKHTKELLNMTGYDSEGNVLNSDSTEYAPDDVIPGSFGEGTYNLVCAPGFPGPTPQKIAADPDSIAKKFFELMPEPKQAK